MDSNQVDQSKTSLLKTTVVRVIGATCTCTVAVMLALGALDALTENSLSRAAGIANAKTVLSEWLPARVAESEARQVALVSPTEAFPNPTPDSIVGDEPAVTPVVQPELQPLPRPAPPPTPPVAAKPESSAALRRTVVTTVASRAPDASPASDELSAAHAAASNGAVKTAAVPLPTPSPYRVALAVVALRTPGPANSEAAHGNKPAKSEGAAKTAAVPLPTPAPKRPPLPPTPAQRLKLDAKARAKAEKCLAEAVYFEARSESLRGQLAVAQVVMNRVFSPFYPNDVCGVVYQNAHRRLACQFTFACDGIPERVTEWKHWRRAKHIAKQTLDGKVWVREVAKSTHYHAVYVRPVWVREMRKMVRYGVHTFYRPRRWGDGSKETSWSNISRIAARVPIVD